MEIDRDSTEYLYFGWSGDPPAVGAEVAFMAAAARPTEGDWDDAIVVDSQSHELWDDAVASGVQGDYYVAILVGSFGGNTVVLTGATAYQPWNRLTDTTERPIRVAPVTVEVL
jgi:hypothetical protein